MKIYLDIDGTLIHKTTFKPANYLKEFLTYVINHHDVYWLTTHCNGDSIVPTDYLMQFTSEIDRSLVELIKPTGGYTFKTEVLDLSPDNKFLWFDDQPFESEYKLLEKSNHSHHLVRVNLDTNPNIFQDYIGLIESMECL